MPSPTSHPDWGPFKRHFHSLGSSCLAYDRSFAISASITDQAAAICHSNSRPPMDTWAYNISHELATTLMIACCWLHVVPTLMLSRASALKLVKDIVGWDISIRLSPAYEIPSLKALILLPTLLAS
jgi:hypothetical protein